MLREALALDLTCLKVANIDLNVWISIVDVSKEGVAVLFYDLFFLNDSRFIGC